MKKLSIAKQLKIIHEVRTKERAPDVRLTFGRYYGTLLTEMIKTEDGISYLKWVISEDFISERLRKNIKKALTFVKKDHKK